MEIPLSLTQPLEGRMENAQEQCASVPFVYDIEESSQEHTQLRAATQREDDDIEDSPAKPSTLSFVPSTPAQIVRRPLILRPIKRAKVEPEPDSKFARDCFAGEFASVPADTPADTKAPEPSLSPSFLELLRGVCSVFSATHGRDVDFDKVCKAFQ